MAYAYVIRRVLSVAVTLTQSMSLQNCRGVDIREAGKTIELI